MSFYGRGEEDAYYDFANKQFGDVPAILTATYSESPTSIEMEHYAEGYFEASLKLGVPKEDVRLERQRFLNFLAGSTCETHFFGKLSPHRERKHRY